MNDKTDSPSGEIQFQSDNLQRFIFDNASVRGEWVHLQESWQDVLDKQEYPEAIQQLLGEMMAAAALLAATIKIDGRLVLQIRSTGPVDLIMVECTSKDTLRAFAQWDGPVDDKASLLEITGEGTLAITIEAKDAKQPYQGVVSLQGVSIATVLESYFRQSEQLETRIWLAANRQAAAGLFLQQLPNEQRLQDRDEENWSRISQLAATVSNKELLSIGVGTLLHRLFHEEECRLLAATELSFSCSCSRERVAETIGFLGEEDATSLAEEQGHVEVVCEFCNEHYRFDQVDVAQVFTTAMVTKSSSDSMH